MITCAKASMKSVQKIRSNAGPSNEPGSRRARNRMHMCTIRNATMHHSTGFDLATANHHWERRRSTLPRFLRIAIKICSKCVASLRCWDSLSLEGR